MKSKHHYLTVGLFIICALLGNSLFPLNAQDQNKAKPAKTKKNVQQQLTKHDAPELVSPADKTVLTNFSRETKFEWKAVAGAKSYEIEVEYNDGQWKLLKKENCAGLSTTINFIGDNPGRWRVRAVLENGEYTKWKARAFKYNTSKQETTKPKQEINKPKQEAGMSKVPELVSPAAGARFNVFPRETKFSWKAVAGAQGYEIEVEYYTGKEWKLQKKENVALPAFTLNFKGAQPGRWRVCTIAEGKKSPFSQWKEFSYSR